MNGSKSKGAWGSGTAQQVKVLAAKPDDLSSVPRTWRKEERDSCLLTSDLHKHTMVSALSLSHAQINVIKALKGALQEQRPVFGALARMVSLFPLSDAIFFLSFSQLSGSLFQMPGRCFRKHRWS